MTFVQDATFSALLEERESVNENIIIKVSTSPEDPADDIFKCPPMSPQEHPGDAFSHAQPSGKMLLLQVAGKLERQDSCMSVGSLESSEDSHSSVGDDFQEESASICEDGHDDNLKTDVSERCERSSSVVSDASEEGGRDSGIEAEKEPDMIVPDRNLMEKIVAQVEFYFSDVNVVKDKFLLKHIRRNKEGFVSLKLVSSFKKVKQLTKDWRVVAYSLDKTSSLIQINEQRTKIRRVNPLPEIDDSPVTCAVLALDLPLEKPSVETVSKLFGSAGDISFVRVLRAGGALPSDVKSLLTKYPLLGETNCAWIEFETPEAAKSATRLSDNDGMNVVLIVPESQKKQDKQQKLSRKNSANKFIKNNQNPINNQSKSGGSRKNSYNTNYNNFNNKYRKDSGSNHEGGRHLMQRRKAISLPSAQNPFLCDPSLKNDDDKRRRPKSKSCTEFLPSSSPPPSWVQRHLLAAAAASAASAASPTGSRPSNSRHSRVSFGSLPLNDSVIRLPRGPDGTKGFSRDVKLRQIKELTTY